MTQSHILRRKCESESWPDLDDNPVIARILTSRGIGSREQMSFALNGLPPPNSLYGMEHAVNLLAGSLRRQERILIVGDYDADGATSTALALSALQSMGGRNVGYLLPNRFEYGYGLSPEIVSLAKEQCPDLIVTVDNGIASVAGVEQAHAAGIRVLITDHHLPPDVLPSAEAIVNPNLPQDHSGCENLAGVGVIFYVMLALRKALVESDWFEQNNITVPNLAQLLDLVAIGTVADLVRLDAINLILVEQGLRRIRADHSREGIRALLRVAGISATALCSSDIGFAVGPRLNAAGRLSDMTIGVTCLLEQEPERALALAEKLDTLNTERRAIEKQMRADADAILAESPGFDTEQKPAALCLYEPHWHQGVVGILAGRIKDRIHRPVIVFAADENGRLKGSGRSIAGVHLRDALDSLANQHPGLIEKFGGHAMAAGLSLEAEKLPDFTSAFSDEIERRLSEGVILSKQWFSDGELTTDMFSLPWAETLRFLAPWGQGFPEPVFDGEFDIRDARIVGGQHLKLKVSPSNSHIDLDAIAFQLCPEEMPCGTVRMVYRLHINEFRGERKIQLLVEHIESTRARHP